MEGIDGIKWLQLLNDNTPIMLLVGILLYLNTLTSTIKNATVNFDKSIKDIATTIGEMKKRITWSDTCGSMHAEVNRRLDKVEKAVKP